MSLSVLISFSTEPDQHFKTLYPAENISIVDIITVTEFKRAVVVYIDEEVNFFVITHAVLVDVVYRSL